MQPFNKAFLLSHANAVAGVYRTAQPWKWGQGCLFRFLLDLLSVRVAWSLCSVTRTDSSNKLQHSYHYFQVWFTWARSPWLVFPCSINCCFDLQETKGRKFPVWDIHLFLKELLYKTPYAFCIAGVAWGSSVIVDNTLSTIHQHAREKDFPGSAMPFVEQ